LDEAGIENGLMVVSKQMLLVNLVKRTRNKSVQQDKILTFQLIKNKIRKIK